MASDEVCVLALLDGACNSEVVSVPVGVPLPCECACCLRSARERGMYRLSGKPVLVGEWDLEAAGREDPARL